MKPKAVCLMEGNSQVQGKRKGDPLPWGGGKDIWVDSLGLGRQGTSGAPAGTRGGRGPGTLAMKRLRAPRDRRGEGAKGMGWTRTQAGIR